MIGKWSQFSWSQAGGFETDPSSDIVLFADEEKDDRSVI
jgi:hypothetical protein